MYRALRLWLPTAKPLRPPILLQRLVPIFDVIRNDACRLVGCEVASDGLDEVAFWVCGLRQLRVFIASFLVNTEAANVLLPILGSSIDHSLTNLGRGHNIPIK